MSRYVERDSGGAIIGAFANPQPQATELLADDDADLVAFLTKLTAMPTPLPSPREWLERLSDTKQAAIATAGAGNAAILLWLLKAAGTPQIDVSAQETKDGVAALVTAGVITSDDEATLLAP